jgi:RimJ/RimL family protein N-acetyltransferase
VTPEVVAATTETPIPASKPIPIGTVSLMNSEPNAAFHRDTMIGVTFAPSYQGQGYGTETILWALEWCFRHANMHRVGIGAFAYNEGAWKLYERLGFVHEGRRREAVWYDGAYHDTVELSMLKREWQERYGEAARNGQTE